MQTTLPTGFATLPLNNICSLLQANSLMFMVTFISLDLVNKSTFQFLPYILSYPGSSAAARLDEWTCSQ